MPVIGFKCPVERRDVDWDHFERCTALRGRPAYPPWLARMVARKTMNDVRHASPALTATRVLGCPRRTWLDLTLPYRIDPTRSTAAHRGTALHVVAANEMDPDLWYTESSDPVRMQVHGTLFREFFEGGVQISAQMDALRRDLREIVDWKFPKDWSVRYRKMRNGMASPEQQVQLNIGRLLLAQQPWARQEGYDPASVKMTVWDHAIGDREGPEPMGVDIMSEQAILNTTPFGTKWTVGDVLAEYVGTYAAMNNAGDTLAKEAILATIPLMGAQMMNGSMCTGYCDVSEHCERLVREYGAPATTK